MIRSTAIIHPSAKIGSGVTIDAYAIIGPDVILGDKCHIQSHAILEYTDLGAESIVFPHASIGLPPQHLKYKGEPTRVKTGERCTFRESVTVHRGTALDQSLTSIGNDCYFMALSHVAHDCRIGNNVIMANGAQLAGHIHIEDFCFISSTVGIHQFVRIGTSAFISGGAMVPLDVAPFCIAQGDRARIRGLNLVGLRRRGVKRDSIKAIKEAYRTVFQSGLSLKDALASPAMNVSDEHVALFRQFFSASKRGFLRPDAAWKEQQAEEVLS